MTEAGIRAALKAGAAGVIAKSVNENPAGGRQLDRADYVRLDADGVPTAGQGVSLFNRSGLNQRSTDDWFAAIAAIDREARSEGRFVAASIVYASAEGAVSIASAAHQAGLRIFELNVGAPHASEAAAGAIVQETDPYRLTELVRRVRAVTGGMQLWVKLTGLSSNLPALAIAARHGGADAVGMMGRFMALVPDLETFAPVLGTSAAYGGGAVEVVSVIMHEGFAGLTRVVQEVDSFLGERRLTFRDLVGRTADSMTGYAEQPETPGRWRDFVPSETLANTESAR